MPKLLRLSVCVVAQGYSFKGKKEEEIYSKKLTPKNILKAEELLKEASDAIEAHKDKYEKNR